MKIQEVNISKEVRNSFLDYAMSVIVSRALPDVRDGLKPVHRRIIYAMANLGMYSNTAYKKSARIVGEVIGKYHPHGDSSVYGAMVRMAQDFSCRYPLIDGQGNFGSLDGDMPAAMRYTEARLSKLSNLLVKDIDSETVKFRENYDSSEIEPEYLPCYFPNLLVNGSYGIAVGMATNIPPHNLGEVIDAVIALSKNPDITIEELLQIIKGPDLPTGAYITNSKGLYDAYATGSGSIQVRSKVEINIKDKYPRIIVTEIPYQINKIKLLERIAYLVNKKEITDINDLRDQSNRKGVKIVIQLKKHAQPEVILNKLYKLTPLQVNMSINLVALDKNCPKKLTLIEILKLFIEHYLDIIVKRTKFQLKKATKRLTILEGLLIALNNIEKVISVIKKSDTNKIAQDNLIETFKLSSLQAKSILEMKLQRLTNLEKNKITDEINNLNKSIKNFENILSNKEIRYQILRREQEEIKNKFGNLRQTKIIEQTLDIDDESIIRKEDFLVILSKNNYIKKNEISNFSIQNRGGKGSRILDKNFSISKTSVSFSLNDLLLFTNYGLVYRMKTYKLESYNSKQAKGLPINNIFDIQRHDRIETMLSVNSKSYNQNIYFVTKNGIIKKSSLKDFTNISIKGKKAIKLQDKDNIVNVFTATNEKHTIMIATRNSNFIRFNDDKIRASSRVGIGVKGIRCNKNDYVVGSLTDQNSKTLIFVSDNGIGKKVKIDEFIVKGRGGKGVKSMNLTTKTGKLKMAANISDQDEILIISKTGHSIRIHSSDIPLSSRFAMGVKLINLSSGDKVEQVEIIKNIK